jgi:hypothetical protein
MLVLVRLTKFLYSEKLVKQDSERREYDLVVIGEEPYIAYNRVGLSTFFEHRNIEDLYLNPKEWVSVSRASPNVYAMFSLTSMASFH